MTKADFLRENWFWLLLFIILAFQTLSLMIRVDNPYEASREHYPKISLLGAITAINTEDSFFEIFPFFGIIGLFSLLFIMSPFKSKKRGLRVINND